MAIKRYVRIGTMIIVFFAAVVFRNILFGGETVNGNSQMLIAPAAQPITTSSSASLVAAIPTITSDSIKGSFSSKHVAAAVTSSSSPPISQTKTLPAATSTAVADPTPTTRIQPTASNPGAYHDGKYKGEVSWAYYGYVQVQITVADGKLTDVKFLEYPNHARTSVKINKTVMPWLKEEAIKAQSANVQFISGASATSIGFRKSLDTALQAASGS